MSLHFVSLNRLSILLSFRLLVCWWAFNNNSRSPCFLSDSDEMRRISYTNEHFRHENCKNQIIVLWTYNVFSRKIVLKFYPTASTLCLFVWIESSCAQYFTIIFSLINQIYYGNLVTQWNGFMSFFVRFFSTMCSCAHATPDKDHSSRLIQSTCLRSVFFSDVLTMVFNDLNSKWICYVNK